MSDPYLSNQFQIRKLKFHRKNKTYQILEKNHDSLCKNTSLFTGSSICLTQDNQTPDIKLARSMLTSSPFSTDHKNSPFRPCHIPKQDSAWSISSFTDLQEIITIDCEKQKIEDKSVKKTARKEAKISESATKQLYFLADDNFTLDEESCITDQVENANHPSLEKDSKQKLNCSGLTSEAPTATSSDKSSHFVNPCSLKSRKSPLYRSAISDSPLSLKEVTVNKQSFRFSQNSTSPSTGSLSTILEDDIDDMELQAKIKIQKELEKISMVELSEQGLYLCPSTQNTLTWYVMIVTKRGIYKNRKFKVLIDIPLNYPKKCPRVYFLKPIFHPMIEKNIGEVDLSFLKSKNHEYFSQIPTYIKTILENPIYFTLTDSYNSEAGIQYWTDLRGFVRNVSAIQSHIITSLSDGQPINRNIMACVQKSVNTALSLSKNCFSEEKYEIAKNQLLELIRDNISNLF